MKQGLKTYQLELRVCGPVFVGDGLEIQKKEYIFLNRETVGIVDMNRLYTLAKQKHLAQDLERFLAVDTKETLKQWAERCRIPQKELEKCLKYKIYTGDIQQNKGRMQIMSCIKDPYGNPYIPGSSLKGMLRTILLCDEMLRFPERYKREGQQLKKDLDVQIPGKNRKQVLARNIKNLETLTFHTLEKSENKRDAVNDKMSGIIVSDSEPISIEQVILCQKWEHHTDGNSRTLNLLRECLSPGTVIKATLTVDQTLNSITAEQIQAAVKNVYDCYYENFQKKFRGQDRKSDQTVFLGGGSGFVSKTVLYSLYEAREAVSITQDVFLKTGVPKTHKHYQDVRLGVSPHILKCTRYQGKEYMMGQCELNIIPDFPPHS